MKKVPLLFRCLDLALRNWGHEIGVKVKLLSELNMNWKSFYSDPKYRRQRKTV